MNIARHLSRGTAGWLSFEFHCERGRLFEEKYLSAPIGQILAGRFVGKVETEVEHPLLTEQTVGPGKRPKIDFAVRQNDEFLVAVEAKWAGATPLKVEAIIWDLIRLELLAHHFGCQSFFVLAGQRKRIKKLFDSAAFRAERADGTPRPILKEGTHRSLGMKLDYPPNQRRAIIKRIVNKYPEIEIPSKVSSGQPFVHPVNCNGSDFQVYVWQIKPAANRECFTAKNHKLYA